MSFKLVLTRAYLDGVQGSDPVRAQLLAKAQRILPRAQRLAYDAGAKQFGDSLHIVDGTRPGTKSPRGYHRAFVQVVAGSEDAETREFSPVNPQAILRKAMGA